MQKLYEIFLSHPKVVTDSRKIEKGCLFFALKGERFNGNQFAAKAVGDGAAFAVIDEQEYDLGNQFILVEDVLKTLQKLANHHRRQFQIPVLAITGSNGKTTTKELVNAVISSTYPTHCTQGNFNNHIGVPLTLLAMPPDTQIAIIEMGANHQGEIDFLCRIVEPTHGLITNIGKAHLEGFGGIDGVKKGKSELYRYLAEKKRSVAFVNMDEQHLTDLSTVVNHRIFYRKSDKCNADHLPFEVELLAETPFLKIRFSDDSSKEIDAQSNLTGLYNFNNLMTAAVVGTYFKVPGERIKSAIETYVPQNNRSQLMSIGTNTLLLDAYNANPTSMRSALLSFSKIEGVKKVAIIGAMRELGEYSEEEHRAILDLALSFGFAKIILVGPEFEKAAEGRAVLLFHETTQVETWLAEQYFTDTHFLLKASRSVGLEQLVDVFKQNANT